MVFSRNNYICYPPHFSVTEKKEFIKMKKIFRKILILVIVCSLSIGTMPFISNSSSTVSMFPVPDSAVEDAYLNENAWLHINNDGDIYSSYSLSGTAIELKGIYWDIIYDNYQYVIDSFQYANWQIRPNSSESDNNLWFNFQFRTENSEIAKLYASYLVENVEFFSDLDYSFSRSDSWSNWDGSQNVFYTTVYFDGHASWNQSLETFNDILPRDRGGLAETIDINCSNNINWRWNLYSNKIQYDLSFDFDSEVDHLEGDYVYSVKELLHVDELKKSTIQSAGSPLSISISLPNIKYLSTTNRDDIRIEDQSAYREPWDKDNFKYIYLDIQDEYDTGDLVFSFTHKFVPWDLQPREDANLYVNPYGYSNRYLNIYHENAYFVNWSQHIPNISKGDIVESHVEYDLRNHFQGTSYNINFYFQIKNDSISDEAIWDFTQWVNSTYGWDFEWNSTGGSEFWIDDVLTPTRYFYLYFNRTDSFASLSNIWLDTWIFQNSEMLHHSDLSTALTIRTNIDYHNEKGGYYNNRIYVTWDDDNQYNLSPNKLFSTSSQFHSLDVSNLYGWPLINKSKDFDRSRVWYNVPSTGDQFILNEPEYNYGYGYDSYHWINFDSDGPENIHGYMTKYVSDAYHDENGVITNINNIQGTFQNTFYEDSVDLGNPYGYYYKNFVTSNNTFAGVENITMQAHDRSYDGTRKWNGTDWVYRYGISPVVSVEGTITFSDFSLDRAPFSKIFSMDSVPERNTNENEFYFSYEFNSSQMADGDYEILANITDQAGNRKSESWAIRIDNYNDSLSEAPQVAFISPTPLNNAKVNGTIPITLNITDDINIFAIVVDIGGSEYLLNEDNYMGDGIYVLNWTTTVEPENSQQLVEVSVWDIEGHKNSTSINFIVDNLHAGDPPEITLIIPGVIEGEMPFITGLFNFSAEIYDDQYPLKSVQFQIDDRVQMDMDANITLDEHTGLFSGSYDVSNLVNGTHTLTIIAIDRDDPTEGTGTHIRTVSIEFFANTTIDGSELTNAPEIHYTYPGNFTSLTDTYSEDIQISVDVHDDEGIEAVNLRISTILGTDLTDLPSQPQDVDISNIQIAVDTNMWLYDDMGYLQTYKYDYDSTTNPNGIYLIEITVGDVDPYQHKVTSKFLMIVINQGGDGDNPFGDNPFADIPGFSIEFLIISMGVASFLLIAKFKRNLSPST